MLSGNRHIDILVIQKSVVELQTVDYWKTMDI